MHFPASSYHVKASPGRGEASFLPRLIDSANIPVCLAGSEHIGNRYQAHNLQS